MTSASKSRAESPSTVVSTATGPWPFFPVTGWSSRPATVTVTSSSRSRYNGYSNSMSSNSLAASRRTFRPAKVIAPTLRRWRGGSALAGDVRQEDPGAPVGQPGGHAAVRPDQRRQAGKVLIDRGAGLACQGDPQAPAARVAARVAQGRALPPGQTLPPRGFIGAPPVQ